MIIPTGISLVSNRKKRDNKERLLGIRLDSLSLSLSLHPRKERIVHPFKKTTADNEREKTKRPTANSQQKVWQVNLTSQEQQQQMNTKSSEATSFNTL
jgi:hypothetical protein